MVFQIVPQPANRASGLETGEIDAVVDFYLPKSDEPRLMKDPALQYRKGINIPAIYFLMFNVKRPRVRQHGGAPGARLRDRPQAACARR